MWAMMVMALGLVIAESAVVKYAGIPDDASIATVLQNGALLNRTLSALRPGDELVFPNATYYLMGGIIASNLRNNVLHFEGTLKFSNDVKRWPRTADGRVLECLHFESIQNVTFTSSGVGRLDGQGEVWWGFLGYLEYQENRPRLLSIGNSRNLLIENMYFKSSPYWTVWIYNVDGLEIRYSEVSNRFNDYDGHDITNLRSILPPNRSACWLSSLSFLVQRLQYRWVRRDRQKRVDP